MKKILLQLDTDERPSSFDAIVAVDSGADVLLSHGGIRPENVQDLVYGCLFTRGPPDLGSTAIFVGGSDVELGERVHERVQKTFFGPMRVSTLLDSGGANTTAAAALVAARRHAASESGLEGVRAAVLGSTGPVGRRVVRLLARQGADVVATSRSAERAEEVCASVRDAVGGTKLRGAAVTDTSELGAVLDDCELVIAAGGPGVCLLPRKVRESAAALRVAIDLNAVPPEGIEGVGSNDKAAQQDGQTVYGALGVGGIKMKIHRACIERLFESNQECLDAEQILAIGIELYAKR